MGKWTQAAQRVREAMDAAGAQLDDAAALAAFMLYSAWTAGTAYTVDSRVRHGENLYRCIQAHTSQSDWTPNSTPALWVKVSVEEWPEWVQPTGAHDAYAKGDKVTYKSKRYISLIDGNTYSPDDYPAGWEMK